MLLLRRRNERPNVLSLFALLFATGNALWAIDCTWQALVEQANTPPWKGANLDMGLLALTAPLGMLAGPFLFARGIPRWLVLLLEMALAPLALLGFLAAVSV